MTSSSNCVRYFYLRFVQHLLVFLLIVQQQQHTNMIPAGAENDPDVIRPIVYRHRTEAEMESRRRRRQQHRANIRMRRWNQSWTEFGIPQQQLRNQPLYVPPQGELQHQHHHFKIPLIDVKTLLHGVFKPEHIYSENADVCRLQ